MSDRAVEVISTRQQATSSTIPTPRRPTPHGRHRRSAGWRGRCRPSSGSFGLLSPDAASRRTANVLRRRGGRGDAAAAATLRRSHRGGRARRTPRRRFERGRPLEIRAGAESRRHRGNRAGATFAARVGGGGPRPSPRRIRRTKFRTSEFERERASDAQFAGSAPTIASTGPRMERSGTKVRGSMLHREGRFAGAVRRRRSGTRVPAECVGGGRIRVRIAAAKSGEIESREREKPKKGPSDEFLQAFADYIGV